jgi:hypothetical protein
VLCFGPSCFSVIPKISVPRRVPYPLAMVRTITAGYPLVLIEIEALLDAHSFEACSCALGEPFRSLIFDKTCLP